MKDYVLKTTAANGGIRAYIARTTEIVKEGAKIHNTSISATAALGRLLTAASLMGSMLKNKEDLVTLTLKGNGPIKGVVATSDFTGNVKGYVFDPSAEVPLKENGKIDVPNAIGFGTLTVIKDIGLKEPSVGQVDLMSGEIAEDLTYYFAQSEQTPASVSLGVLVDSNGPREAGGFIIQLMPGVEEEIIDKLEEKIKSLPPFTTLLDEGKTPEEILNIILGDFKIIINEKSEIEYSCNCSRDRVEKALISLGKDELRKILEEDKYASLHCHFCGKDYNFTADDLTEIINNI